MKQIYKWCDIHIYINDPLTEWVHRSLMLTKELFFYKNTVTQREPWVEWNEMSWEQRKDSLQLLNNLVALCENIQCHEHSHLLNTKNTIRTSSWVECL